MKLEGMWQAIYMSYLSLYFFVLFNDLTCFYLMSDNDIINNYVGFICHMHILVKYLWETYYCL